jgi:hypothetical protein
MAEIGGSANDAFGQGLNHTQNAGHANTQSLTLGGSLQATSDRWNGLTPHVVRNTGMGAAQNDGSFQQYQREQGGYQPGSMTKMQDQLEQGNGTNIS